jgi:DUF2975 family protein
MKAFGKGSVSSALLIFLNTASIVIAFVLVVAAGLVVFGVTNGWRMLAVQLDSSGRPSVDAGPNVHMSIPVAFHLDPRTLHVAAPLLGIHDAELTTAEGALRFVPQAGPFFAANVALVLGLLGFSLWVLTQLRALFRALRDGRPFAPENAARVRRIAWTVIAAELLRAGIVYGEHAYAVTYFVADGIRFDAQPHVNVFAIVNGLIILVISEVFRVGTRLAEEQSLTV